ncbi:Shedu anti-phage system protein SduA domain-containing protein [Chryseobacterium geocarposphaerae]|uniref:Uncharacterized protein DUF4263 n=1 Tax=Chryseobacterium geocarposphaerae TaxID=1416776 RepID=A0A2M9CB51_9FLAO|nr:Shedu anti-phage system protein SduA domain-containing protein [Chryseobacterium geocarposphaerae]PJJ68078.1 uncharacterized protein DUF4263 [Chryseobacterium geocarposphaerae]
MKINDYILRYTFPNNYNKDGICRIRTFVNSKLDTLILITDLDTKNTSMSITNSIEVICKTLIEKYRIPETTVFIEHYEPSAIHDHTFDLVKLNVSNDTEWESITFKNVIELLECNDTEINNLTLKNTHLLEEIEQLRTLISPHSELPSQFESKYMLRQFEIENNMIKKNALHQLIINNSNETEFLNLLRKDLSFFAEIYASPNDSYICFSEFPLDNGFVDFVILTGRSRMDVFLIEIKGADFSLLTQNSYKKFNYKIDTAASQIRDRLGYIHRNIISFRKFVHEVREKAFSGEKIFNAFVGPEQDILVDKNKDINIHNIIIGGRTQNDLEESYKRHDFETNFNLPIKLESWDSFYRKLRRK